MNKKATLSTVATIIIMVVIVLSTYWIIGKPVQQTGTAALQSLKTPDDLLTEGRDKVVEGKCRSAIRIFTNFIILYEDSQQAPEAWYRIGKCYAESNDDTKAQYAFEQVNRYDTEMYARNEYLELAKKDLGKLGAASS